MDKRKTVNSIIQQYNKKYMIILLPNKSPTSLPKYGAIFVDKNKADNPTFFFLFTLLHEIGHCVTYKDNQRDITKEYLATQWAIDNSNKWKIFLDQYEKEIWQEYVYSFTKAKNKSKYQLDWSPMKKAVWR